MLAGHALSATSQLYADTVEDRLVRALLRLQASHHDPSRWLAAPVPSASRWSDWRRISGQWRMENGQYDVFWKPLRSHRVSRPA
ncbi:hypothetical protein B7H26_11345 [Stenotrophomonas maltophilia]|nr:hypothetical protein B7H26_11345 [Stenotrophomonas maltophilia]OWQ70115.1 hypothetical protein CEE56_12595 [Stenotrophomonas maltophilia]